jgi:curved DNA-binding protein CbpA
MKSLYDLLGALPDDDAESIRAAFRKAAKANHPDNNPGDPDAPQRFRRIVRANAILSDERQRATYDRLLEIALQQQGLKSKRGFFSNTTRRAAIDTVTGAALSVGLFGGACLLLVPAPQVPFVPAPVVEIPKPEAAQTALVLSVGPSDTVGRAGPDAIAAASKSENVKSENTKPENAQSENTKPESPEIPKETPKETPKQAAPPGAIASSGDAAGAAQSPDSPPPGNSQTEDAKYYQDRGISAYRNGDLYLALVDFDLAISLDPTASDSYINRAIVYHRIGDMKHAFADVSQAKRLDNSNRGKALPPTASAP